ncbi:MFS transporter [Fournierella massiliensis]|uniref:MFS transporter n=1 Tax=Allofournierella massiliensis TaxID=1650663 RepID=A0ABT7UT12_9FIRM|nr:MFS transporter [Fournierella massiliensis]
MGQFVKKHPFVILAAGAAIQLLAGIPTAWGVFQEPVRAEYGFEEETASFVLSWLVAAFGAGGVAGGFLQDKLGPRFAALLGSAGLCAGFVAAGFVPGQTPWLFYLAFSAPVGAGCAFLYPAVMGCAQKWYADKKGLATGVIGVAVGLSGAALTVLVKWFTGLWGIRGCFWALGALLGLVCGGASLLLQNPPSKPAGQENQQGMTPREMLRTSAYWWITASVALATPAVLLFSPRILELARQSGLPETAAAWMVAVGAAGSAAGRLSLAAAGDKLGRRAVLVAAFGALAALSAGFAFAKEWLFLAVYAGLCFFYAGQAAVLPSLCTERFGLAHTGVNYGLLALGMTAGSLGFPFAAKAFGLDTGRHWLAVGAALAGAFCLWRLGPAKKKKTAG